MSVATVRRVVCRLGPDHPPTDAELVAAIGGEDRDAAFTELVGRYGPMVLGVCRRVLTDAHDAEDAFQAAFLVLARRAGTVRPPGAVGGWLYGVAVRTARKAKTAAIRRRRREMTAKPDSACRESERPGSALDRAELRAVIDAELAALPETHRAAVVLCDLHGKTRAEAALELNRPEGTVAAWLTRGRKALARRLAQRGVALPTAGLLAVAGPAAVSAELTSVAVAALVDRGASATVLALAEGVMRSLSSGTTKLAAALVAAGALLAAVATAGAWHTTAEPKPEAPPVAAVPDARGPHAVPPDPPAKWREKATIEVNDLVDSVAVDPDGKRIAVGTLGGEGQNTVTVWDANSLKKLWTGGVLPAGVTAVAFSPNGKTVAATRDKVTGFYEAATGKSILMNPPLPGGHALAFSPNGERLAVSNGKLTSVTDLPPASGEVSMGGPPAAEKNPARLPAGVAWHPDGKRLAMIRHEKWDGKWPVLVWGAGSAEGMVLLAGHDTTVTAVAWSKDGALLTSASADGAVVIWDGKTFKEVRRVKLGTGKGTNAVHALAFTPDGKMLAVGLTLAEGKNVERVVLLDTATGDQLQAIQPLSAAPVAVAFTPDGKSLLVGCGSRDPEQRKLALDDRKKLASLRLFRIVRE